MVDFGTQYLNIGAAAREVFDVVKLLGRAGDPGVGNLMGRIVIYNHRLQLSSKIWGSAGTEYLPPPKW